MRGGGVRHPCVVGGPSCTCIVCRCVFCVVGGDCVCCSRLPRRSDDDDDDDDDGKVHPAGPASESMKVVLCWQCPRGERGDCPGTCLRGAIPTPADAAAGRADAAAAGDGVCRPRLHAGGYGGGEPRGRPGPPREGGHGRRGGAGSGLPVVENVADRLLFYLCYLSCYFTYKRRPSLVAVCLPGAP